MGFIIGAVIIAIFFIGGYHRSLDDFYYNRIKWKNAISKADFEYINSVLENFSSYYKQLNSDGKAKFIQRILYYTSNWEWVGKEELEVTYAMQLKISAAAAQLTFGLTQFSLDSIKRIAVFPSTFYSEFLRRDVKGLTVANGLIILSWKDFEEGFADDHDHYNLGLHEMAHALNINTFGKYSSDHYDVKFAAYYEHWERNSLQELQRIKRGNHFLRKYGATNAMEFFAVCVEYFFEVPDDFRKELPDLYARLCFLLNQDPLKSSENFILDRTEYLDYKKN